MKPHADGRERSGFDPVTDRLLVVAREMLAGGRHTMQEIADTIEVGPATLYRHLEPAEHVRAGFARSQGLGQAGQALASQ